MKFSSRKGWHYLFQRLPFNKSLEAGVQDTSQYNGVPARFDYYVRFNFTGHDHAGLKTHVQLGRWFFELSITDRRHWNYEADRWCEDNWNEAPTDCDANQDSNFLHGGEPNPDGLGSTYSADEDPKKRLN